MHFGLSQYPATQPSIPALPPNCFTRPRNADAQPNTGDASDTGLLARIKALSADGVYTTLIGEAAADALCWCKAAAGVGASAVARHLLV